MVLRAGQAHRATVCIGWVYPVECEMCDLGRPAANGTDRTLRTDLGAAEGEQVAVEARQVDKINEKIRIKHFGQMVRT